MKNRRKSSNSDTVGGVLIGVATLDRLFGIRPKSLIHIGAHLAEESSAYDSHKWGAESGITWVEAQDEVVDILKSKLNPKTNRILNVCAWSVSGLRMDLNVTSNSQSTSLLAFGDHSRLYPEIYVERRKKVTTLRLDEVLSETDFFEFINLDVQGAELEVLLGMGNKLFRAKWIYAEVNSKQVYLKNALVWQIDEYLEHFGFKRVLTEWVNDDGWGDALYVKEITFRIFIAKCIWLGYNKFRAAWLRLKGSIVRLKKRVP